jgi:hypothetical protein
VSEPVDVSPRPPVERSYIGDGVHASFDGHHIWLKTGNGQQIALEPNVYFRLREYAKHVWGDEA